MKKCILLLVLILQLIYFKSFANQAIGRYQGDWVCYKYNDGNAIKDFTDFKITISLNNDYYGIISIDNKEQIEFTTEFYGNILSVKELKNKKTALEEKSTNYLLTILNSTVDNLVTINEWHGGLLIYTYNKKSKVTTSFLFLKNGANSYVANNKINFNKKGIITRSFSFQNSEFYFSAEKKFDRPFNFQCVYKNDSIKGELINHRVVFDTNNSYKYFYASIKTNNIYLKNKNIQFNLYHSNPRPIIIGNDTFKGYLLGRNLHENCLRDLENLNVFNSRVLVNYIKIKSKKYSLSFNYNVKIDSAKKSIYFINEFNDTVVYSLNIKKNNFIEIKLYNQENKIDLEYNKILFKDFNETLLKANKYTFDSQFLTLYFNKEVIMQCSIKQFCDFDYRENYYDY